MKKAILAMCCGMLFVASNAFAFDTVSTSDCGCNPVSSANITAPTVTCQPVQTVVCQPVQTVVCKPVQTVVCPPVKCVPVQYYYRSCERTCVQYVWKCVPRRFFCGYRWKLVPVCVKMSPVCVNKSIEAQMGELADILSKIGAYKLTEGQGFELQNLQREQYDLNNRFAAIRVKPEVMPEPTPAPMPDPINITQNTSRLVSAAASPPKYDFSKDPTLKADVQKALANAYALLNKVKTATRSVLTIDDNRSRIDFPAEPPVN